MIWITGDTHSDFRRFDERFFPEQKEMTKDDYVIICGDFGGIWHYENTKYAIEQEKKLKELNSKPFTTLFVDGNHENYDLLNTYDVEEWHGGRVQRIRDSIIHLMRGEMYDIEGLKIFTFGGAASHDIDDGIIDSSNWMEEAIKLRNAGKRYFRINHISWWKEELPSNKEINHATEVLEQNNYECDFFISHCCSSSTQALMGYHEVNRLTKFFETIKPILKYKKHIFGHYHDNINLPDNEILIYEQIIRIH